MQAQKRKDMKLTKDKIEEMAIYVEEQGLGEHGGSSITDFCKAMGIDRSTFYDWIKDGRVKNVIDEAKATYRKNLPNVLENSLRNAAIGSEYEQVTTTTETDSEGNSHTREQRKNVRIAPNVQAAIFLLTNLEPTEWKNRQSSETKVEVEAFKYPVLTDEQMQEAIAINEQMKAEQYKK